MGAIVHGLTRVGHDLVTKPLPVKLPKTSTSGMVWLYVNLMGQGEPI